MLKFATRLAKQREASLRESQEHGTKPKPVRSHSFSFTQSPLTRLLSGNVGKGHAAHDAQRVAEAAVCESGIKNVTPSRLVALGLFSVGWLEQVTTDNRKQTTCMWYTCMCDAYKARPGCLAWENRASDRIILRRLCIGLQGPLWMCLVCNNFLVSWGGSRNETCFNHCWPKSEEVCVVLS